MPHANVDTLTVGVEGLRAPRRVGGAPALSQRLLTGQVTHNCLTYDGPRRDRTCDPLIKSRAGMLTATKTHP